jgi:ferritin-like metal-binding protein YciE
MPSINNSDDDMASKEDIDRLERKIDAMAEAMQSLIRVEERQANQGQRIGENEKQIERIKTKVESTEKKVDQWINRGIGARALVITVWALLTHLKG